jgi:hypothetical protein
MSEPSFLPPRGPSGLVPLLGYAVGVVRQRKHAGRSGNVDRNGAQRDRDSRRVLLGVAGSAGGPETSEDAQRLVALLGAEPVREPDVVLLIGVVLVGHGGLPTAGH